MRTVLALLLIYPNTAVSTESLMQELWGEAPPLSATTTLQTYIYQLRKLLHRGPNGCGGPLYTKLPGYALSVEPDQLDAHQFQRLATQGSGALMLGDAERASDLLQLALGLWRGRALADVERGPHLEAYVAQLEERKLNALEQRIEADLLLGRHRDVIGELKALTTEYPLHEWFYIQLMVALYRCGRRYEALEVYRVLRAFLREELGLDPSAELQRLQRAILAGEVPPHGKVVAMVRPQ